VYLCRVGLVILMVEIRFQEPLGQKFEIKEVDINKIHPHEEIIPRELERVKNSLLEDGILKYPVVVSQDYYVLLDGHHRWKALQELGCKKIPCVVFDYFNDMAIMVDTWYPVINLTLNEVLSKINEKYGDKSPIIPVEIRDPIEAKAKVDRREFGVILTNGDDFFGIKRDRNDIMTFFRANFLKNMIYFDDWRWAMKRAKEKNQCAVLTYSYTKSEITEAAINGVVFTPKTTRHVVPTRYPRINIPIDEILEY